MPGYETPDSSWASGLWHWRWILNAVVMNVQWEGTVMLKVQVCNAFLPYLNRLSTWLEAPEICHHRSQKLLRYSSQPVFSQDGSCCGRWFPYVAGGHDVGGEYPTPHLSPTTVLSTPVGNYPEPSAPPAAEGSAHGPLNRYYIRTLHPMAIATATAVNQH